MANRNYHNTKYRRYPGPSYGLLEHRAEQGLNNLNFKGLEEEMMDL